MNMRLRNHAALPHFSRGPEVSYSSFEIDAQPTLKLGLGICLKSLTGLRHVYRMLREPGLHGANREHSGDGARRAGSDPHKLALGFNLKSEVGFGRLKKRSN